MIKKKLMFDDVNLLVSLCGNNDKIIKIIEKELNIEILPKGNELIINGSDNDIVNCAEKSLNLLYKEIQKGKNIDTGDVKYILNQVSNKIKFGEEEIEKSAIVVSKMGKIVKARTIKQYSYIENVNQNDVNFSIGPAGTGKTYLAVAMGINSILSGKKDRLILTRPVVEAGESLGYLPGDLQQKINPYLRPLFDSIMDMIGIEEYFKYKEKEIIEIAPLAYMRGRTLNNAFIILDEAQNTSIAQMKMFLTRLGETSKMVITGDITQIDLPKNISSGLIYAYKILNKIKGISFTTFTNTDIIRHPLVKRIIDEFEKREKNKLI